MNWVRLGDILKITSGGTPTTSKSEYYAGGDIPWVKTGDLKVRHLINIPDKITKSGLENSSAKIFPVNTVLIAMYGATIGNCSILKTEAATNQACAALLPNESVNEEFLFFYLSSIKQQFIDKGVGGGQPNISAGILKDTKFPLFTMSEQKRVVKILENAATLIAKRKESIALLDEYLKSTFLEMFGDPVRNEKGWTTKKMKEVCLKITDGTHFSPPIIEEGYPYITAKHVRENKIDFWAKPWFISEEDHKEIYKRCTPKKGDVLYIKDGATTGYAAINKYDFEFSMLSSLALLKVNPTLMTSEYLCAWLNNPILKAKILLGMSGGAIQRLTLSKINDLPINLPPVKLQLQFSHKVEKIESLKAHYQQSLVELENMYGVLSQKAFSGELQITKLNFHA